MRSHQQRQNQYWLGEKLQYKILKNNKTLWDTLKAVIRDNSLLVQWIGLWASTSRSMGSILGQGSKISHIMQSCQKKKEKNQNKSTAVIRWMFITE